MVRYEFGAAALSRAGVYHALLRRLGIEGRLPGGRRSIGSPAARQAIAPKGNHPLLFP